MRNPLTRTPRPRAATALLFGLLLSVGGLSTGLAAAATDAAPRPLIDMIRVENGTRSSIDGGDFLVIRVGDQAFGVVYGSAESPGAAVTLFTVFTRSLGVATVTDNGTGREVARNVSIPVRTLIAQRLDAAFEFRDLDGNGIFNFRQNLTKREPLDVAASDFLIKAADLRRDWNLTDFEMVAVSHSEVHVSFVLSTANVTYEPDILHSDSKVVEHIAFTVHVVVTRERHEGQVVPHFAATVDRESGKRQLTSLVPDGTVVGSWWSTRAAFKVDHDIVGWDFAPPRENVSSLLMLHTLILYLNALDGRLAPWVSDAALANSRAGDAEIAPDKEITSTRENATVDATRPREDFAPADSVALRDHWHRVGKLVWVSTAQVWARPESDPVDVRVRFQVLGGVGFALTYEGALYRGFVLSGGFVYPSGWRIYHDPQLEAASVELDASSSLPGLLNALVVAGEVALAGLAALGVVALAARASSKQAAARAAQEAARVRQLRERYHLPGLLEPPQGGA